MSATDFFRGSIKISKREKKNLTPRSAFPPPRNPPEDNDHFKKLYEDLEIDNASTLSEEPVNNVESSGEGLEIDNTSTLPEEPVNNVESSGEGLEGKRGIPPKASGNRVESSGDGTENKDSDFKREMYRNMRSKPR